MTLLRFFIFCALLLPFFSGCQFLKDTLGIGLRRPQVGVRSIQIAGISPKELRLKIKLEVENPNSFDIIFSELTYVISLNDKAVAKGNIAEKMVLGEQKKVLVEVPLTVATREAVVLLRESLFRRSELIMSWKGQAKFHTNVSDIVVPFASKKKLL